MSGPVLVATHHSTAAREVVERAAMLAAAIGADLHAVSVLPELAVGAPVSGVGAEALAQQAEALRSECIEARQRHRQRRWSGRPRTPGAR